MLNSSQIFDKLFQTASIKFNNVKDFDEVCNWEFGADDIVDIGHSEQIIIFKDNDTLETWLNAILFNHINAEDLDIDFVE